MMTQPPNPPSLQASLASISTETPRDTVDRWVGNEDQNRPHGSYGNEEDQAIPDHDTGFATSLFQACFQLLTKIMRSVKTRRTQWTRRQKAKIASSYSQLCLWGDSLGSGQLEALLTTSSDLHDNVIDLLRSLGNALVKGVSGKRPVVFDPVSSLNNSWIDLRPLLEKAAVIIPEQDTESLALGMDSDAESTESEDETRRRADMVEKWLREVGALTQLLMDLCPTLEQVYRDRIARHSNPETLKSNTVTFHVTDAAKQYVLQVHDKYRKAEVSLVERLGEANWQRFCKLREVPKSVCHPVSILHNTSAVAREVPKSVFHPASISHNTSTTARETPKSVFHPVSNFHDSGLGSALPPRSQIAFSVASHTSYLSSMAEEESHKLRVPKTPEGVVFGDAFECFICHRVLKSIKNRIDWKMHVFADLRPYICTFKNCTDMLVTFPTRAQWSHHELACHRSHEIFKCHDCSNEYNDRQRFREHLLAEHQVTDLSHTQSLALISAAKSLRADPVLGQACPLCLVKGFETRRKFTTHLGRHMEEISLSALPWESDSDSDVESDNSYSTSRPNAARENPVLAPIDGPSFLDEVEVRTSESKSDRDRELQTKSPEASHPAKKLSPFIYPKDSERVIQLLEAGVDINAQGGLYGNALMAAALEKDGVAVVRLLVEAGADVNAQGGHYGNALAAAACKGSEAVVQLLVEAGADVNAQGGHFGNALAAAAVGRHEAVARLLVEAGADVNAQGGFYGNALVAAALEKDGVAVVRLLLEAGADVNAQGGHYGSALAAAAYGGSEAVVQLLVEAGADVNAQGGRFGNALGAAAYLNSEATVRLLLEAGADVNAQGGLYGNALMAAVLEKDGVAVVRLLVEAGADVNAQGGHYGNALAAAACKGSEAVVQLLVEAGADVNAQGGHYGNALKAAAAAYGHNEAVVRLLLKAGADSI